MLEAVGEFLPMAIGLALSPLPIAAVMSLLLSERPTTALWFLFAWVAGIMAFGLIVFSIPGLDTERGEPTALSGWIRIAIGVGLLVLARIQWGKRPKDDGDDETSSFLAKLDSYKPVKMVGFTFLFSALNPKGLAFNFTAAAAIHYIMPTFPGQVTALGIYTVLASLNVIIPILGFFLFAKKVRPTLSGWKDWLIVNNTAVITVLLLVFGALIIGSGLKVLSLA